MNKILQKEIYLNGINEREEIEKRVKVFFMHLITYNHIPHKMIIDVCCDITVTNRLITDACNQYGIYGSMGRIITGCAWSFSHPVINDQEVKELIDKKAADEFKRWVDISQERRVQENKMRMRMRIKNFYLVGKVIDYGEMYQKSLAIEPNK